MEYINSFNNDKHKFKNYLKKEITCVAITTTFYVEDTPIIEIINYIREVNEDIKIIVGGPRCLDIYNSYNESKRNVIWNYIGADCYIIESQGEETLCKLVAALKKNKNADLSEIGNIVYKIQKDYTFTYANKENNCLDSEIINWDYFKSHDFVPSVYMRTSRGCCYACTYCTYPVFSGKYVCSDVSTIEKEMDILYSKGVKYITFIDDSFNIPNKRFIDICELMIRKKYNFKWLSFFRCSNFVDKQFELMKKSGCIGVYLGIESLSKSMLKGMNKNNIDYISCIKKFNEYNIPTMGSFIVGFPGETEETIKYTIDIFKKNPTTYYNPQLYYHSENAPINKMRDKYGIEGTGYNWSHNSMNWLEAIKWKNYMIKNVDDSILLPLYGSGIWALPYLLSQGIDYNFFKEFSRLVACIIKKNINNIDVSLDDAVKNFSTRRENYEG